MGVHVRRSNSGPVLTHVQSICRGRADLSSILVVFLGYLLDGVIVHQSWSVLVAHLLGTVGSSKGAVSCEVQALQSLCE